MANIDWESIRPASSEKLAEARMQLHSAVQWLARIERSYGQAPAANNPVLQWHNEGRISTQELESSLGLELRLPDLIMQFTENGAPSRHEIDLEERSPAHVEAWMLIELLHRGVDRGKFSKDLPHDVSSLMSGDGVEFSPDDHEQELREIAALFRNAALVLSNARGDRDGATRPIRFSPQDMSIEVPAGSANGSGTSGTAFGFAPGDADTPEPFFYISRNSGGGRDTRETTLRISEIQPATADRTVKEFFMQAEERA